MLNSSRIIALLAIVVAVACENAATAPKARESRLPPGGILQVTPIAGPDTIFYPVDGTYSVTASQGVPPYRYQWSSVFPIRGSSTGPSVKVETVCVRSGGNETLSVTVTDAENFQVSRSKAIHLEQCG